MDPANATILFLLFLATEKAVKYAGGKVADSMTKPIWEALEEKAKWLAGKDDTAKRWDAFIAAFVETRKRLEANGRHPELAKHVAGILNQFDLKTLPDNQWLDNLTIQLEKASLVNQKPDETLLVELFNRSLPKPVSRAELSEVVTDFISYFKDALFGQKDYQDLLLRIAQWENSTQGNYDTRERYLAQVIAYNEDLDFVGIPELKDRQALRIGDVFISLQTQVDRVPDLLSEDDTKRILSSNEVEYRDKILEKYNSKTIRRLSVNQALNENSKLVILGDPGSGKTTLLKYIVLAYAENKVDKLELNETKLPIFIRLYDYVARRAEVAGDGFSFVDYLYKYCTDHLQLNLPPMFFEEALEKGDCCICLDGLDELGTAGIRREVTQTVSALRSRYPNNRFIVTSRIVGYEEAPLDKNEFFHHTIQPLSDDDIKLFVEKWYKARERDVVVRRERTEHLVKTIMGEERIKSLAANPLMLTIIALVHRIEAELPNERVKLYDKCVTTLVETWDKVRGLKTTLRRRLLEKLAYWMHSQPGEKGRTREVREGTLRKQIIHFLQSDPRNNLDEDQIQKEAEEFITLVKTRSGLLVERGEDVYTFSHLTFQEYLAARDIERRCSTTEDIWKEIQPKLLDAHWREVILLLLGSLNSHDYHNLILVRNIFESKDDYEAILHRYLILAAQALSDRVEIEAKLHDQIVDSLLALLDSKNFWNQDIGFDALGNLKNDPRAANGLQALARDEKVDAGMRHAAAQALGQLGRADEAARWLLALVGDEKVNATVRRDAAQALGQLGRADGAVINGLQTLAGDERVKAYVRSSAAQALGQLGHMDEAVRWLLELVGDKKVDSFVRRSAAQALGRLGRADEAVRWLLALAEDEKANAGEIRVAMQTLGQLGSVNENVVNDLMALVRNEKVHFGVRRATAQALGRLGRADEAVLNGLQALARDEKVDAGMRHAAAQALGQLGRADEAARWLLALVGDEKVNATVRRDAAQALGQLGRVDEAANGLLTLAEDQKVDSFVRRSAAQALGQLGRADEAARWLLALAGDEKVDAGVRRDAAQALGQLGRADEAARWLQALAGDERVKVYVRSSAAQALGQLGHMDEAVRWLLALAEDNKVDDDERSDIVQALGQLGRPDGVVLNKLLALVGDERVDILVRYYSFESLKSLLS